MKRASLLALFILLLSFSLSGCRQVKDIAMDMIQDPEEIVVSYVTSIGEIYVSDSDCDKVAQELSVYCENREQVITKAIQDMILRLENNKIDAKRRNEIYDELKKIKSVRNVNCTINPRLLSELTICAKPVVNALSKF